MFECLFYTSLHSEEGDLIRVTITFFDAENPQLKTRKFQPTDKWRYVPFAEPLPLNVTTLGFSTINSGLACAPAMKENQQNKINHYLEDIPIVCQTEHVTIQEILENNNIPNSSKSKSIFWSIMNERLSMDDTENYLRNYPNKKTTEFKRMLSAYDFKKYNV